MVRELALANARERGRQGDGLAKPARRTELRAAARNGVLREHALPFVEPRAERTDDFEDDGIGNLIWVVRVMQWIPTALAWIGVFAIVRFSGARAVRWISARRARSD